MGIISRTLMNGPFIIQFIIGIGIEERAPERIRNTIGEGTQHNDCQ
jgi:hypothetical protein